MAKGICGIHDAPGTGVRDACALFRQGIQSKITQSCLAEVINPVETAGVNECTEHRTKLKLNKPDFHR